MKVIVDTPRNQRQHHGVLLSLSLLVASSMACVAKAPVTEPQARTTENYTSPDHSFTLVLPDDWKQEEKRHPYGDLTTISGVRLTGPMGPDGVPVTISVLHYSGERLFKTPDEFIRHKLNSIGRIDYDRKALLTDIKIAKRPGKAFQIKTFELVYLPQPPMGPMQEGVRYELAPPHNQVDMLEQYCVIPASKGYFVLSYRASEKTVEEYQGTFDKVVGSFHPMLP
jgi:hypothetical protein